MATPVITINQNSAASELLLESLVVSTNDFLTYTIYPLSNSQIQSIPLTGIAVGTPISMLIGYNGIYPLAITSNIINLTASTNTNINANFDPLTGLMQISLVVIPIPPIPRPIIGSSIISIIIKKNNHRKHKKC